MMKDQIKIVDFARGIRANEINQNFSALKNQLDLERKSVGGCGISNGFNFTLNDFSLTISDGFLIDSKGKEVYVEECFIDIQKPILINTLETLKTVDSLGRIYLNEIPYSLNRTCSVEHLENFNNVNETGISIVYSDDLTEDDYLTISDVNSNVITIGVDESIESRKVNVKYSYTFKRRDLIYIDKNYKINIKTGITSPSPSLPSISEDEYIYILAYIEIDAFSKNVDKTTSAKASLIKEFKSTRNVYTDENNKLYLCGTPFDSIKIIHMVEPSDPEEGTLWYDMYTNKLKIWRHTDTVIYSDYVLYPGNEWHGKFDVKTNIPYLVNSSQLEVYVNNLKLKMTEYIEGTDFTEEEKKEGLLYSSQFTILKEIGNNDSITYRIERYDGLAEWVSVNDATYLPKKERYIWTPIMMENIIEDKEFNMQHFLFDFKSDKNMLYVPQSSSLEVMIDQTYLHSDQFDEITIDDAIAGEDAVMLQKILPKYYNYKNDLEIHSLRKDYENTGIGFKLEKPLQKKAYVEAIVTHIVKANPLTKRFQRSATFVNENNFRYIEYITDENGTVYNEPLFTTSIKFLYGECQLEVFLNGKKLIRDIDFIEVSDNDSPEKGEAINKFKILENTNISNDDLVEYKITTTIYTYDHLDILFEGYREDLNTLRTQVSNFDTTLNDSLKELDTVVDELEDKIEDLKGIENNINSKYLSVSSIIGKDNLESTLYAGIMNKCFYENIQINSLREKINITNICTDKDFLQVFNTSSANGNKILIRNLDYLVLNENGTIFLQIENEGVHVGNNLYLTGINFNKTT